MKPYGEVADRLIAEKRKMNVCYVLSYRSPNYVRTLTILEALSRIDGLSVSKAVNTSRGVFRYIQTLTKLILTRIVKRPDFYILGLRGFEIFWPVRLITLGKPLIFDHMMSPYDSMVHERRLFRRGSLLGRLTFAYEKSIIHHADLILTDTALHRNYFSELFHAPKNKIHAIPVSTDETLFLRYDPISSEAREDAFFHIFFYGSFLPLHGVDIILEAAQALSDQPVQFSLIGGEKNSVRKFEETKRRLQLKNVLHRTWVDFDELPNWIERADLCLGGPFGNTGQGKRVITGKTFQFLAMGKPTVVGEIEGDQGFIDKDNCLLVPQGDAQALTGTIRWALKNRDKLHDIGRRGRELYLQRYSIDQVKNAFLHIFESIYTER